MSFAISSHRRPLALVALARSVSWLGDEVALVALLLRLQHAGVAAVTALWICGLVPAIVLAGVVGRAADRFDTRTVLTVSSGLQAVVCLALAWVTPVPVVLALVAVLGVGQAVNAAGWSTAVPSLATTPDDVPFGVSWMQAGVTLAGVVAPGAGGLLAGTFGTTVPLLVDTASFVAVLVIGLVLPAMPRPVVADADRHGGASIVRRDPLLLWLTVLVGGFVLVGAMVNVVEVFLVRETLGASSTWFGVCGMSYAVGALAGTLLGGRVRGASPMARMFVGSAMLLGLGLAVMGVAPTVGWLLPAGMLAGFGQGAMNVAIRSLVLLRAPAHQVGRVSALLGATVSGTQLAAFAVGGVLAGLIGARLVFVCGGLAALLVPALFGRALVRAARPGRTAQSSAMTTSRTTRLAA